MTIKFKPLYDRVIVRHVGDQKTDSGLIIAGSTGPSALGEVVAVGPGRVLDSGELLPLTVKVGDTVLYHTGWGAEVSIDGEKLISFAENELVGVLTE